MTEPAPIVIQSRTEEERRLWAVVQSLAVEFGSEGEWSLIGGLMVQLHAFEREDEPRPTADIDLLGGARKPPRMTESMASLLLERGAEVADPPRSSPDLGYRFEYEGRPSSSSVPMGFAAIRRRFGKLKRFQTEGGSQALRRTEVVRVSLDGEEPVAVRRPNLLGAILIKARVVAKKRRRKFESDREDFVRLLAYVEDARALAADMSRKEPRWLRDAGAAIDFDEPDLGAQFSTEALARARQTLRLLAQESYSASSTK